MQAAARRLVEAKKSGKLPPGAEGVDPTDQRSIARFYEKRFKEDAFALGMKVVREAYLPEGFVSTDGVEPDPTLMPRATEAVPGMIAVIRRLIDRGHAYAVGPAGRQTVYFSVQSFAAYGSLSGNTLDALRSGEGGRVQAGHQAEKRHPGDFLLWKSDPSHAMRWKSPWGEGYPGWHIECSAMSAARLLAVDGRGPLTPDELASLVIDDALPMIDLHSGGEDNIFPHHECEIAQSCCAFNASPDAASSKHGMYAAHWFHPRFLQVEGAKMSKSKGNFFTPRELFEKGHEPAAVRLELIKTHYRSNANFTEQGLKDSGRMVERWRRFAEQGDGAGYAPPIDQTDDVHRTGLRRRAQEDFAASLMDDLGIAGAIGAINLWLSSLQRPPTRHDADVLRQFDAALGILSLDRPTAASTDIGLFIAPAAPKPEITALLSDRAAARAAKDFKRSDAIRDQLAAMGYAIKDVAGVRVEVRKA
jgi:cysteinyl-tRNA synthetase